MNIVYIPQPITSASFGFEETTVYGGLPQWYSIFFTHTNAVLSSYPFLRFILDDGLSFNDPPQCNSSTLVSFNESGLICIRENSQSMKVYNFKTLNPLGSYEIWFRLETTLPYVNYTITPTVDIQINHNFSVDNSIVSNIENLELTNPVLPILAGP